MTSGVAIWIIGLYVLENPPKKINRTYGYRTPRAMKSQEAWDYAQVEGTRKMIIGAKAMCLISLVGLFVEFGEVLDSFIAIAIMILAVLIPLAQTEQELKERFGSR